MENRNELVVLACKDANGSPAMVSFEVVCTEEDYQLGNHYDTAEEKAVAAGYEGPFICFDNSEHKSIAKVVQELNVPIPFSLKDSAYENTIDGALKFGSDGVGVSCKGYSDYISNDDEQSTIALLEYYSGNVRLIAWSDINQEDHTDVIDFENAKINYRQDD